MGSDKTRASFAPTKGFSGVHKQQGRVTLDSEFNEFEEILDRKARAEMYDTAGQAAVPMMTPDGFKVGVTDNHIITIGVGRAYVDGILVECFGDTTDASKTDRDDNIGGVHGPAVLYEDQPFHYTSTPPYPEHSTVQNNTDLVYLDVWQREVTVFEDEALREVALNGPDTATRVQTAWQVKTMPGADATSCVTPPASWASTVAPSTARLSTAATKVTTEPSACVIDPVGGFTGIENRLYRVEIHDGGTLGIGTKATIKWSRDNASLAATVTKIEPAPATALPALFRISVVTTGPDCWRRFEKGDHLEILDDDVEFAMRDKDTAGTMARVINVNHTAGEIDVDANLGSFNFHADRHPRIRRWDFNKEHGDDLLIDVNNGTAIELEEGITITFGDTNAATLHAGDYWVFSARTATGTIDVLEDAPPRGILHHFARLGLIKINADHNPELSSDCRHLFPPLSELTELYYVGGDGQEAVPATASATAKYPLLAPLEVAVANGEHPVANARVRFTLTAGQADILIGGVVTPSPAIAFTDPVTGIASCDLQVDPEIELHRVRAELVDITNAVHGIPVDFTATVPLQLRYVGGDGQQVTPIPGDSAAVAKRLEVAVVCGRRPAPFRTVRFAVAEGTGQLTPPTDAVTDGQGIAWVNWKLDPTTPDQAVTARLVAKNVALEPPVRFRARLRAAFAYVGGDAQQALPGALLAYPLEVAVLDPPVAGRKVRFSIMPGEGTGTLRNNGSSGSTVDATTDATGVASCTWQLDSNTEVQRVSAQRLDPTNVPTQLNPPVHFTARLLRQVEDPGIHILAVEVPRGQPLLNDSEILPQALADGMRIVLEDHIDSPLLHPDPSTNTGSTFDSAVFVMTVDVPFPVNSADAKFWDATNTLGLVGFTPVVFRARINVIGKDVFWFPSPEAQAWLRDLLFQRLVAAGIEDTRLLVRVTLLGNFIWSDRAFLDGDSFGTKAKDPTRNQIDLLTQQLAPPGGPVGPVLSGDRRRGGDFRMWFWLKKTIHKVGVSPSFVLPGGTFSVQVELSDPAPQGGAELRVSVAPPGNHTLDDTIRIPAGQRVGQTFGTAMGTMSAGQLTVTSLKDGDTFTVKL